MNELLKLIESLHAHEIIFFGGTFSPWHEGHSACLKLLPENKTTIVLPDHNPEKCFEMRSKENLEEMIRPHLKRGEILYTGFLELKVSNPTYEWIDLISRNYPEKELSLLIGFDQFLNIHRWKEPFSLLKNLSHLYVVSRMDTDAKKLQMVILKNFNPELKVHFLGGHDFEEVSGSKLRAGK